MGVFNMLIFFIVILAIVCIFMLLIMIRQAEVSGKLRSQIERRDREINNLEASIRNFWNLNNDNSKAVKMIWFDYCHSGQLRDNLSDYFPSRENNYEVERYEG